MFFSIIVPIYNVEAYLDDCLHSIKEQLFDDYEVLMIDDGSTDNCARICENYSNNDNRFIYIRKKNEGVVSARKKGAEIARGRYIVSVDGDDYVEKTFLERLHHICKKNYDMVAFGYNTTDEKGNKISKILNKIALGEYTSSKIDIIKEAFMYDKRENGINGGALIFSVWSKAVKRDMYNLYQQSVDDRISKGDDLAVLSGLVYHCESIYVTDSCDYNYRIHNNSITRVLKMDDFIKQSVLRDFLLLNVDNRYANQVRVFLLYTAFGLLVENFKNINTFQEYSGVVKCIEKYDLFKEAVECEIAKASLKNKILIWLLKNKLWNIIYLYLKLK